MADIWIYIAIFAIGNTVGIILAIKLRLGASNTYKGRVKIKNKRNKGPVDTDVTAKIEKPSDGLKKPRKNKRKSRPLDRKAKKD